ncbi:hypothetical protein H8S90_17265 [Olivibacter sp. SDN3]|uniref:carbohydrate-binding family 9-like protein n=1 Tax=Olivibacter sp. SDN3 TaxID=2764720 RepID=UPI00165196DA|nr:carbohydrate-binding family 9-like protein [Olivibacter sp. SDN3]QNL48526.1 hypothetical protein H8S90_17265 [Olivibacter sp. SDN3]
MKKKLQVEHLQTLDYASDMRDVLDRMNSLISHRIEIANWEDYNYVPKVEFKIAYTNDSLLIQYLVAEKDLRAIYNDVNDPVYKDSCVEFFVSFNSLNYYNFEFNCIGTPLVGYGTSNKANRTYLAKDVILSIKKYCVINSANGISSDFTWQLTVNIPFSVFTEDQIGSLAGKRYSANFYKCGDDLPEPHFVSWSEIKHPTPNFHLPQFFGDLIFK